LWGYTAASTEMASLNRPLACENTACISSPNVSVYGQKCAVLLVQPPQRSFEYRIEGITIFDMPRAYHIGDQGNDYFVFHNEYMMVQLMWLNISYSTFPVELIIYVDD